jgi:hypothetical protein
LREIMTSLYSWYISNPFKGFEYLYAKKIHLFWSSLNCSWFWRSVWFTRDSALHR